MQWASKIGPWAIGSKKNIPIMISWIESLSLSLEIEIINENFCSL